MKKVVLIPLLGMVVAALSCQRSAAGAGPTGLQLHAFVHDSVERRYWLYVPDGYREAELHPAILALHGGGGTGKSMCALKNGFLELADEGGFLLVCPDGVERHWNDGRGIPSWRAHQEGIDDVGFITALVEDLAVRYSLDRDRIYAAGISNGGLMSYRLACESAGVFRAIAAVTASLPVGFSCMPGEPISVLVMNGTEDPLVPYEGGSIRFFLSEVGVVRSTEETIQFWVETNGCTDQPVISLEPDLAPDDKTRVQREVYDSCNEGTKVVLYQVQGGGHSWPGSSQYLPKWIIGRLSKDIHASSAIWEFFSQD